MEDLEDMITYNREALTLSPLGHPDRSCSLINLANGVHIRYGQSGRIEDLEEAITCFHEALTLCPLGHPDRSNSLINLANGVHRRYDQLGRLEDLEEAITFDHQALTLCQAAPWIRSVMISIVQISMAWQPIWISKLLFYIHLVLAIGPMIFTYVVLNNPSISSAHSCLSSTSYNLSTN